MNTNKRYNMYTFLSTIIRNIIDIYSVIYIYKLCLSIKKIILIYLLIYLLGILISKYSLIIGNKIGYKYILIFSTIISTLVIYIVNKYTNPLLISLFLSLSIFTYTPIKHLYNMQLLHDKKSITNNLIISYIAILISSYIITTNIKIYYLMLISLFGLIPIFFIKQEITTKDNHKIKIKQSQKNYFIFEQFKFIFILFEPLYIYLIANNIKYVGIYNIILTLSSIIFIYIITNKININKTYKYINILFTPILLLKLNVKNQTALLIIAILEGIGIKTNELVSSINLHNTESQNSKYITECEKIFCITRVMILLIMYILPFNLLSYLYILLIGIFILSFKFNY